MGTQFSSRLSDKDAREILQRIASAFSKRVVDKSAKKWIDSSLKRKGPAAGKKVGAPGAASAPPKAIASLAEPDRRALGDHTVSTVLAVAESHNFYDCFLASTLFTSLLEALLKLRSDAAFNGFNRTIAKYDLEKVQAPLHELSRGLSELAATSDKDLKDPLHGAAVNAAKGVLAQVATINVSNKPDESKARQLGRQLEKLDTKAIVTKYVAIYIKAIVTSMLDKAAQEESGAITHEAIPLADRTAERVARRVLERAEKAGVIDKPKAIREIAIEELKQLGGSEAATPAG